jgi:ABC-type Na+ efflux pump permease subunit
MLEIVLQTAKRSHHAFGVLMGLGLVRLVVGIAVAVVLIWLLVKVIKLVEAYTKKLK